jgi:hypothetical protein
LKPVDVRRIDQQIIDNPKIHPAAASRDGKTHDVETIPRLTRGDKSQSARITHLHLNNLGEETRGMSIAVCGLDSK